jgi:hypothetical protein
MAQRILQSGFRPAIPSKLEPATVTKNLFGRDAELSLVRTHRHLDARLLDLDRRIEKLELP